MIELTQPGSGKVIRVADESAADKWRARGYGDAGPTPAVSDDLGDMTKAELLDHAERNGIEVTASSKKAEILDVIRAES